MNGRVARQRAAPHTLAEDQIGFEGFRRWRKERRLEAVPRNNGSRRWQLAAATRCVSGAGPCVGDCQTLSSGGDESIADRSIRLVS